jgi:hypothetical protein
VGWAICGATIVSGREFLPIESALFIHAIVAPLTVALLSRYYFLCFPNASPLSTAVGLLGIVLALDAFVVAPFFVHCYAMFHSILGTWLPFALIFAASYVVGHKVRHRSPTDRP